MNGVPNTLHALPPNQVCAADWKPGQPSMVADPVGSLDYFSKVYDDDAAADDIAPKVRRVNTPDELRAAVAKGKVVVDFCESWSFANLQASLQCILTILRLWHCNLYLKP